MSDVIELSDADFATQMHGLVHEAERELEDRAAHAAPKLHVVKKAAEPGADPTTAPPEIARVEEPAPGAMSLFEMLRPVVQGLQAVGRASGEHTQILSRLDKSTAEGNEARRDLPRVVTELRSMVDQRNTISRQMFDALHEELKSYKDGFLLDTVHRPMIRDLITLYDDLSVIHRQMSEPFASVQEAMQGHASSQELGRRLESIGLHLEHNLEFILEVLARLEVTQIPNGKGKLDKRTQRAVAVEAAEDPDEDLTVVRTLKRGFLWKDRVVRAEEVVIKKWKEGFLMALKPSED